jgi:hypothetical protein
LTENMTVEDTAQGVVGWPADSEYKSCSPAAVVGVAALSLLDELGCQLSHAGAVTGEMRVVVEAAVSGLCTLEQQVKLYTDHTYLHLIFGCWWLCSGLALWKY